MSRGRRATVAAAIASLAVSAARADVFEIGDDGSVQSRTGGGVVAWTADPTSGQPVRAEVAPDVPESAFTAVRAPDAPAQFRSALAQAAEHYGVSASLLSALVWHESRWQPAALSNKGAIGLAQLMPATARALAVDPRDATGNLEGAAHYLRLMLDRFDGDVERALAAYNAGPGRVIRANGVPAIRETRSYVSTIIDRLAAGAAGGNR